MLYPTAMYYKMLDIKTNFYDTCTLCNYTLLIDYTLFHWYFKKRSLLYGGIRCFT